ncbi:MAG: hypothetical protein ACKOJF_31590, partial [Planctomycetaceae bacterium]
GHIPPAGDSHGKCAGSTAATSDAGKFLHQRESHFARSRPDHRPTADSRTLAAKSPRRQTTPVRLSFHSQHTE